MKSAVDVDNDRLRELYVDAGMSIREIQLVTDMPYTTVYDRLRKAGIKLRPAGGNRREPPHSEYAKTAFMYQRMEMTTTEISEALGITHDAVCNRLDQAGVRRRTRSESARLRFARRPKARAA